jgi:hypothetical protein
MSEATNSTTTTDAGVLAFPDGIDFDQAVLDMNGVPLIAAEDEVLRLGSVCVNALMGTFEGDKADGNEKRERFNLAQKINPTDGLFQVVKLSSKQKRMVLDMAEKMYLTLLYVRIYEALEGSTDIDD